MKLTIYNPSVSVSGAMGGTSTLLANFAVLFSACPEYDVNYIELENGATVDFIHKNAPNCKIIYLPENEKINIDDGTLIMILLHVKLIDVRFKLNDNVKLVLWSTHPEDGIKLLPLFNLFFRK